MYGFVLDALKFSQCLGKESWHVLIFETKTSGWTSQVPSDAQCNRILPFKIMCTLCGSEPQTTCGILWPYFTLRNNPRCSFTWPVFHRPLWQQIIRQNPDAPDWVCRIPKLNTKQICHMVRNQIPFLQHETIFCLCRLSMHQRSLVPASCS